MAAVTQRKHFLMFSTCQVYFYDDKRGFSFIVAFIQSEQSLLLVCACVLDVNTHLFVELFIVIRTLSQRSGTQHWISKKLLAKTNQLSTQLPTMLHSIVPVLKVSSKKTTLLPVQCRTVRMCETEREWEREREREREREDYFFCFYKYRGNLFGQLWWTTLF